MLVLHLIWHLIFNNWYSISVITVRVKYPYKVVLQGLVWHAFPLRARMRNCGWRLVSLLLGCLSDSQLGQNKQMYFSVNYVRLNSNTSLISWDLNMPWFYVIIYKTLILDHGISIMSFSHNTAWWSTETINLFSPPVVRCLSVWEFVIWFGCGGCTGWAVWKE